MKQFIRYLYEYNHGNRVRNVGFTKVEKQENSCTVHIYGKGLDAGKERKLEVFVFYMKDGRCIGISQGMMEGNSPVISYILKFSVEDVGSREEFDVLDGIVLQNSDGRRYAAMWNDEAVDLEHMKTREEVEAEREMMEEAVVPEVVEQENVAQANGVQENIVQEVSAQEVSAQATRTRESLIEHVEKLVEEQEVAVAEMEPSEVDSYILPSTRTYEKIQRQDISRLPRREWKLANNSFLLHGFYNYHHLMYITEGDHSWLGVPGIYHEKERTAARAFGFPQFHRITDVEIELSDDEKNTFDDFGYWCRQVDRQ